MARQVEERGACSLPGVSIRLDLLAPLIERAVLRGYVSRAHADYAVNGLRFGFDLGIDSALLRGRQRYRNYPSALNARAAISKSVRSRLSDGKTVCLGRFSTGDRDSIPWDTWRIFPLGAVPKSLEPDEMRPVSDHTRTGVNAATDMTMLRYTLDSLEQVACFLRHLYSMRVGDVEAAFPLIPLAPRIWRYFLFHWFDVSHGDEVSAAPWALYVHLCADFGAAGVPGTWHVLFGFVLVGVARSECVISLPLIVYVDDTALIGEQAQQVDKEGDAFKRFLAMLGVFMKELKERLATTLQLYLGFWWDSTTLTRTLEERKLASYMEMLLEFSGRRVLSLHDMQRIGGRMQRAVLTLPPGAACLLANLFALMRGLVLPWQKRRTSRAVRRDFATLHELLGQNSGRGFYRIDHFKRAPTVDTDASKSDSYAGGGYASRCGKYKYWRYGTRASRQPIDALEADAVLVAVSELGVAWRERVVRLRVDNTAFQRSAVKGWSKAERLARVLRALFTVCIRYECVLEFEWLSTHDNVYADALSRPHGERRFLDLVEASSFLPRGVSLQRQAGSGGVRLFGPEYPSDVTGDGPVQARAVPTVFTVPFTRASIFAGVPTLAVSNAIDEMMDSRLSSSSARSVSSALKHWDVVAARHGWPRIIVSDDPCRGGKLATYVVYMVDETELSAASIANYVWAFRSWLKFQRQLDPIYGLAEWDDFMRAVAIVAWVPSEPRKRVPLELVRDALLTVDRTKLWEVQAALLMLILLFSFSRSESPCPKSHSGADAFDLGKHLAVSDVEVRRMDSRQCLAVRLKAIKQDARMERAEAAGNEDWIIVGEVDRDVDPSGAFSVMGWVRALFALHAGARDRDSPFFVDTCRTRALLYSTALRQCRSLWARVVGNSAAHEFGLHGLRVAGYDCARRSAAGEELAVAHGGWHSTAHKRYERFAMSEVVRISSHIVQQLGDEEGTFAPMLSAPAASAAAVPAAPSVSSPAPRQREWLPPSRQPRGSRRASSATGEGAPSGAPVGAAARAAADTPSGETDTWPPKGARLEIYWTDDQRWFAGSIVCYARGQRSVVKVLYDACDGWRAVADRTSYHDLRDVRWRLLPPPSRLR